MHRGDRTPPGFGKVNIVETKPDSTPFHHQVKNHKILRLCFRKELQEFISQKKGSPNKLLGCWGQRCADGWHTHGWSFWFITVEPRLFRCDEWLYIYPQLSTGKVNGSSTQPWKHHPRALWCRPCPSSSPSPPWSPFPAHTCTVKQDAALCTWVLEEACGPLFWASLSLWVLKMNVSPWPVCVSSLEQMRFFCHSEVPGQVAAHNPHTAQRLLETSPTVHFLLELVTCRAKSCVWHRIYSFGRRKRSNPDPTTVTLINFHHVFLGSRGEKEGQSSFSPLTNVNQDSIITQNCRRTKPVIQ